VLSTKADLVSLIDRFADGFNSGTYIYSDSTDLFNWTAAKTLPDGLSGYVRHGTVRQQY